MNDHIQSLLGKFLRNEHLNEGELRELKFWFDRPGNNAAIHGWMQKEWIGADEVESEVEFEALINQLNRQYQTSLQQPNRTIHRFLVQFQKIAAILFFPILLLLGYYLFNRSDSTGEYAEIIVPQGQKSEIILPDSSHVWINSGSRLKYTTGFLNGSSRDVFLEGEAYFEVVKQNGKPFVVRMNHAAVKVLGTKFNVKAYADEETVETSLLSGKVNFILNDGLESKTVLEMIPGQKMDFNLQTNSYQEMAFVPDEIVGWKNNRLIFRDDTFEKLVRKIERWYDVKIQYQHERLNDQRLTLELQEEESIDRLMEIISKVMHVDYEINNKLIKIRPMENS
ncbi:FecR family protein [Mangrovibacterium lignilyticum]|uniref:FecR family protein n=1 Tax=Mangrovibacterium lignilyticum TaxID=2668052 RepID=UPI0013D8DAD9|nr:FecR family protein [Mangrovibacterium lignilyticum]